VVFFQVAGRRPIASVLPLLMFDSSVSQDPRASTFRLTTGKVGDQRYPLTPLPSRFRGFLSVPTSIGFQAVPCLKLCPLNQPLASIKRNGAIRKIMISLRAKEDFCLTARPRCALRTSAQAEWDRLCLLLAYIYGQLIR